MTTYYLGLGSNVGDRLGHLAAAVRKLAHAPGITVVRGSSVYESPPVGLTEQPDFLNLVLVLTTDLDPPALLAACLAIEAELGRVRATRWGPRTIDLDIVLAAGVTWADDNLTIPHRRMLERAFVLIPLAEIAPGLVVNGKPVEALGREVSADPLRRVATWDELLAKSAR